MFEKKICLDLGNKLITFCHILHYTMLCEVTLSTLENVLIMNDDIKT